MAIEMKIGESGNIVEVHVSGTLTREDYERFVPDIERLIKEHGKVRILFEMHDFHGWSAGALWEDIKFDLKHFKDIAKLAVVGEKRWQEGMTSFCKPFTTAKIRYFEHAKIDEARAWVRSV